ncbi:MAG: hypothetical protein U0165_01405 [Polyangiaceae bacterium]
MALPPMRFFLARVRLAQRAGLLVGLTTLALSATAHASPEIESSVLDRAKQGLPQRVIVELVDPLSRDDVAQHHDQNDRSTPEEIQERELDLSIRKDRVRALLAASYKPATELHDLHSFRLMSVEIQPDHLAALARSPDVVRVHEDHLRYTKVTSSVPFTGAPNFRTESTSGQGSRCSSAGYAD